MTVLESKSEVATCSLMPTLMSTTPDFDYLLEEAVQELRIAEHSQGVSRGGSIDHNTVKLNPQLVVTLHHLQNLHDNGKT